LYSTSPPDGFVTEAEKNVADYRAIMNQTVHGYNRR